MRTTLFIIAILLGVSCIAVGQDNASLVAIEAQRGEAIANRNGDAIIEIYDQSFTGITAGGKKISRAEYSELIRTNNVHLQFATEDIKTSLYGNIGIVRGRLITRSKTGSIIAQSAYIVVYLFNNGNWKAIEQQETVLLEIHN